MGHWLLTWTTYGTWLPGDERGYVGKAVLDGGGHRQTPNTRGRAYAFNDGLTQHLAREKLKRPPVMLTADRARLAMAAMCDAATRNGVTILEASLMGDHCHAVVEADDPSRALNVLKGAGGYALSKHAAARGGPWWTRGGKKDRIADDRHLANAIAYVRDKQRGVLARFATV